MHLYMYMYCACTVHNVVVVVFYMGIHAYKNINCGAHLLYVEECVMMYRGSESYANICEISSIGTTCQGDTLAFF